MQETLSSYTILNSVVASVIALIIGFTLLYWKYKLTLTTRIGIILIANTALAGITGVIIGDIGINFRTDPLITLILPSIILGVILGLAFYLYRTVFIPMRKLAGVSEKLAQGDIEVKVPEYTQSDEIGTLSKNFHAMLGFLNLQGLVGNIKGISAQLIASSDLLASSTEEVNASSEEIAAIAQQLSLGAGRQTEQIDLVLQQVEELQTQFEEKSKGIRVASELIETITNEVNILSLNASIEAARAGDYGRGFAVVADNVRRLANNAKQSVGRVNQTIRDLQDSLQATIDNIAMAIQVVASVAQETAASSEEASAATEEQTATMEELTAAAQELAGAASELNAVTKKFKV